MDTDIATNARETNDIAQEVVKMIVRRFMEGTNIAAISAGLALGLNRVAEADPVGVEIRAITATMLTKHARGAALPPAGGR